MSCHDFKMVVEELADGRLMEAAARDEGLAHAAVCMECAARLMEARGIGAGLRVAARAETEAAPARVRAALLTAFAEQHRSPRAAQPVVDVTPPNVIELPARRTARWWFAAAAVAAAILLSLLLSTFMRVSPDGSPQSNPQALSDARPAPTQTPAEEKVERAGIFVSPDVESQSPPKKQIARTPKAARDLKSKTRSGSAMAAQAKGDDYLPLTYLAGVTAMESGTVVRVELSRSALISLGVPVDVDRSDETLKADVVLGDDGIARAIRLVR